MKALAVKITTLKQHQIRAAVLPADGLWIKEVKYPNPNSSFLNQNPTLLI
jgi:hypothetical protein